MSNMLTRAKQAATALTLAVAVTGVTEPTPANAWGHGGFDRARNAVVTVGGVALGVAALRRLRSSNGASVKNKKITLG